MYQNVNGLKTKLQQWRDNTTLLQCDFIAATETNLDDSIADAEVTPYGWNLIRRDRGTNRGGVLLAARPGLELSRQHHLETGHGEDIWASFSYKNRTVHVCVVYIKPSARDEEYMAWYCKVEDNINELLKHSIVIILGDLNFNSASCNILNYTHYFLQFCDFKDHNNIINKTGSKLDVVFVSNNVENVDVCEADSGFVDIADKYHPPLEISFNVVTTRQEIRMEASNIVKSTDWNFAKADFSLLYKLINDCDWSDILKETKVNSAVDIFYSKLYNCFDQCIPKKVRNTKPTRRYPTWFSKEIIADIRIKWSLHKIWKSTKDPYIYRFFTEIRTYIKYKVTLACNDYKTNIQNNITSNPRAFWNYVKSLRTKGGFDPCITHQGQKHTGKAAAEAFANYFSSVFLQSVPSLNTDQISLANEYTYLTVIEFTETEIETLIQKLKPKTSVGPDNVPSYILKAFKSKFASPLAHVFNLSLKTSLYPEVWKQSRVVPILKAGDKSQASNYRPIAILSSLAKLIETGLHSKIYKQVEPYLNDVQHAFRKGRSVNTNLLTLVNYISCKLDSNTQVDVIYLDFQKAFDQVDNDILLIKMSQFGFAPNLLNLFADYLRDRKQFVRLGCYDSSSYHTRSGVSQGSSLGPLLFTIMVDDLAKTLTTAKCLLYADDLKLYCPIKTDEDGCALQQDLEAVQTWSVLNRLHLNISKCQVMTFTRSTRPIVMPYSLKGELLSRPQTVKDLGVTFDSELTFHSHIKKLTVSSFKKLGFVTRNCRDFTNLNAVKILYLSLVRSKLESSACVWSPHEVTYALMVEKVQKRFLRFLYKKAYGYYPFMYPTRFLLGTLGFNSLETRRLCEQIMTISRILRGILNCPELLAEVSRLNVPEQRSRFRPGRVPLFAPRTARTVAHQQSPVCRAQRHLNALLCSDEECDVFSDNWPTLLRTYMTYCEEPSSLLPW